MMKCMITLEYRYFMYNIFLIIHEFVGFMLSINFLLKVYMKFEQSKDWILIFQQSILKLIDSLSINFNFNFNILVFM
jgi:hypothetical protein